MSNYFNLKNIQRIFFYGLLCLVCSGCPAEQNSATIVRFAQLKDLGGAISYIASQKAYYKDEGINLETFSVATAPKVVHHLRSGTLIKTADCGILPRGQIIEMLLSGDEPLILATIFSSTQGIKLLTFSRTGITGEPRTLINKRIGAERNTLSNIYLRRLLQSANLDVKNIFLIDDRQQELSSMLFTGKLDAMILSEPTATRIIHQYYQNREAGEVTDYGKLISFSTKDLYDITYHVVTTRSKLEKQRDSLLRMLQALLVSENFIQEHRGPSQKLLAKWLSLELNDLNKLMALANFKVHLNTSLVISQIQEEFIWLKKKSSNAKLPANLRQYVDASLLRSLEPGRVNE